MDLHLKDKVSLVCAASEGLGKAAAIELAKEGSKVAICSRSNDKLALAKEDIVNETGALVETFEADLSDHLQIKELHNKIKEKLGNIEILVNNVGGPPPGTFEKLTDEDWQKAINLTMMSALRMSHLVLPNMKEKKWGRIINYSGIAPFRGSPGQGTMKMACEGFTRAVAHEYGKYNITANCIGPGSIDVERSAGQDNHPEARPGLSEIPIPRTGTVEECAGLVTFLASAQASYITGQTYLVNGGAHFL